MTDVALYTAQTEDVSFLEGVLVQGFFDISAVSLGIKLVKALIAEPSILKLPLEIPNSVADGKKIDFKQRVAVLLLPVSEL